MPAQWQAGRLVWLELSPQIKPVLGPASEKQLAAWRDAGWTVHTKVLNGPLFWQTVATDEAPALVQSTLDALAEAATHSATP